MEEDLFGRKTYLVLDEINLKLNKKRELIKRNPEYYGNGPYYKCKDYINYKKILLSKLR